MEFVFNVSPAEQTRLVFSLTDSEGRYNPCAVANVVNACRLLGRSQLLVSSGDVEKLVATAIREIRGLAGEGEAFKFTKKRISSAPCYRIDVRRVAREEGAPKEKIFCSIITLGLPTRDVKKLDEVGISLIGELIERGEAALRSEPGIGPRMIDRIEKQLQEVGLSFETKIENLSFRLSNYRRSRF